MKHSCLESILFLPPTRINEEKLSKKIAGKTVIITGASYGIGASIAYLLGKNNTKLILIARTEQKLIAMKKIIEQKGGNVKIFAINLYNEVEIDNFINYIKKSDIKIDIFINNAGKSIMRSIKKSLDRFHDFDRTMKLNYFTPVKLLLALIPSLSEKKGHIIDVSAINVLLTPAPYWAAYQASKSAFDNWFRCASPELNAMGIKTSSIYLPLVKTRMILPTKKYRKMPALSTIDVAMIVAKIIIKERKKYAPWWTIFAQLGGVIFRSVIERIFFKILNKKR